MATGTLYLIPTPISEDHAALPQMNAEIVARLDCFIVENLRSARRFLAKAAPGKPIDGLELAELNEHTRPEELGGLIKPLLEGRDAGLLSEAGMPAVADPGAEVVALCHARGIRVSPLVGPSSIALALCASGLNGQSFAFNGYLPVKPPERAQAIRRYERRAQAEGQSQIFIEAPYRNARLFDDLLATCSPATRLCVAVDLLAPTQYILTRHVSEWRKAAKPEINKRPAIFIIAT
ncbi:MAG: SAM-dependent methyltransferase [Rikenellaceae bacterium]|jgi:16S rRNA (cytidine1402-2'-O)-methyltransferase|nr:SAM-dependent methyltransferase [Rikenellaceae bacterium]